MKCPTCKKEHDGTTSCCEACKTRKRNWHKANRSHIAEYKRKYDKQYYAAHTDKFKVRDAKFHRDNPGKRLGYQRKTRYGITTAAAAEVLESQGGRCAICNRDIRGTSPKGRQLAQLDHDHSTKVVRGMLCAGCNCGLARLGDNTEGLKRALTYLEKTEQPI